VPRVLNKRTATAEELASAVFVGRPSEWGNPFTFGDGRTREQAIAYFRQHLEWRIKNCPNYVDKLRTELRGKNLVCFCAPLPCHADVLLEYANR
jgi:hypothetical protein